VNLDSCAFSEVEVKDLIAKSVISTTVSIVHSAETNHEKYNWHPKLILGSYHGSGRTLTLLRHLLIEIAKVDILSSQVGSLGLIGPSLPLRHIQR
jgi:hypothetical protein